MMGPATSPLPPSYGPGCQVQPGQRGWRNDGHSPRPGALIAGRSRGGRHPQQNGLEVGDARQAGEQARNGLGTVVQNGEGGLHLAEGVAAPVNQGVATARLSTNQPLMWKSTRT